MPTKKILKIIGVIFLAFFIFFLGSLTFKNNYNGLFEETMMSQSGSSGVMGLSGRNFTAPSSKSDAIFSGEMAAGYNSLQNNGPASGPTAVTDKKIIKTGSLSLKVEKAGDAADKITAIAKANGGEVTNSNFSESSRGTKSGFLTVRMPSDKFEIVFTQIKKVATQVLNEYTNTQDITEEYVDLEARLSNKRAEEASFVALLARWGRVEEVLSVTREIARVRGEIEQMEGRLRYLNSQTDMSTITVNLSEDVEITPVSQDWRPLQVFKASVKQLINNGQGFLDSLIRFVIVVLPMLLLYIFITWLVYLIGKKVYYRFKKPTQT